MYHLLTRQFAHPCFRRSTHLGTNSTIKVTSDKTYISLRQQRLGGVRRSSCVSRLNHAVESYFTNENKTIIEYEDLSSSSAQQAQTGIRNDELNNEIEKHANNITDFLYKTRRELHKIPEVMYQEKGTGLYISKVLDELSVPYSTGWSKNIHPTKIEGSGGYGIVADIGTGNPDDPCVLLRADIDALPIEEKTRGIDDFKSQNHGAMHACGHDGHTTMLLGAAKVLKSIEHQLKGTVRLMFQPAEEGGAGAKRMIEEGLLQLSPKPQCAFGMHVWPTLPSGMIASRPGPLLAAADTFEIVITGVGGHAAMPHTTIDPIVTASSIVMNLQTIVSRTLDPLESGVCSITKIESGEAFNIIPDRAVIRGTVRALSTNTLLKLKEKVDQIVKSTAATHGCDNVPPTITYSPDYYPPTINDDKLYHAFSKHVGSLISKEESGGYFDGIEPTMGGEDFSFITQEIPSTFFFIGQGSGHSPKTNYGLHHPSFALDETVMPQGVQLHVNLALRALKMIAISKESNEGNSQSNSIA